MTNLENKIQKVLTDNGVKENKVAMVMATVLNLIQAEACKTHKKVPVFGKQVCVFNGRQPQTQVKKSKQEQDFITCSLILDKNIQDFNSELQNRYMNFIAKIYDKHGKTVKIFTNSDRIKAICKTAQIVSYKEIITKQYVAAVLQANNKKGLEYIKTHNKCAQVVLVNDTPKSTPKNNDTTTENKKVSVRDIFLNGLEKHSLRKVSAERYNEEIPQLADNEYKKLSKIIVTKSLATKHKKVTIKIVKEAVREYMIQNEGTVKDSAKDTKEVKTAVRRSGKDKNNTTQQKKDNDRKKAPAGDSNSCGKQVASSNTSNVPIDKNVTGNNSVRCLFG